MLADATLAPREWRRVAIAAVVAALTAGCVTINVGSMPSASTAPASPDCASRLNTIQMQQMSMEPILEPGDALLMTPASAFDRGDIVAFRAPTGYDVAEVPFIKRVVGLPGESVSIHDGRVFVGGAALVEPYVFPGREPFEATETPPDRSSWDIPAGEVFLLGDHRSVSSDSRVFGPVPITSILGRVTWRCAPAVGPVT
jgi:signal peptidase I